MHVHDRFLPERFSHIRSRKITLSLIQRFLAWGQTYLRAALLAGYPGGDEEKVREIPGRANHVKELGKKKIVLE